VSVTQREIREATGLSQMFVKRNMKILCDYEYLIGSGSGAEDLNGRTGFSKTRSWL
jgi:hypothetical protein